MELPMMMFSILDIKAAAYRPPMFFVSKGVAIRAFAKACTEKDTDFSNFPTDFILCELGTFDETTGKLVSFEPVHICKALDFANPPQLDLTAEGRH